MPQIDVPCAGGHLDVGDGHQVYWEVRGNAQGKPAVVLHGGPGSGSSPGWMRFFDSSLYRVVLLDQRGCGRSRPHASEPVVDLSTNTTRHLVSDIDRLRSHLGIDRWLVLGGSWGATLGLAYAETYSESVSEMVLFSVVTTTTAEVAWVTSAMRRYFPEQWSRFRDGVPPGERNGSLVESYSRLLHDPDPAVRDRAARDWCDWEDTHVDLLGQYGPDPRYDDPAFRLCFARLVTHYWTNHAFYEDGTLLNNVPRLRGIPGVLVQGMLDISGPPDIAWELAQRWPEAELVLIKDAGHGAGETSMADAIRTATDRLAQESG